MAAAPRGGTEVAGVVGTAQPEAAAETAAGHATADPPAGTRRPSGARLKPDDDAREPRPGRRRRIGSAGRLATFHGLVLVLVLGGLTVALIRNFTSSYESTAAKALAAELRSYGSAAAGRPAGQSLRSFTVRYQRSHPLPSGESVVVVLAGVGRVETAGATDLDASRTVAALIAAPPSRALVRAITVRANPLELVAVPITV